MKLETVSSYFVDLLASKYVQYSNAAACFFFKYRKTKRSCLVGVFSSSFFSRLTRARNDLLPDRRENAHGFIELVPYEDSFFQSLWRYFCFWSVSSSTFKVEERKTQKHKFWHEGLKKLKTRKDVDMRSNRDEKFTSQFYFSCQCFLSLADALDED